MQELGRLEKSARLLEPDPAQQERLISRVIAYANDYLDGIASAPVYAMNPGNGRGLYDFPITEEGIDIDEALTLLSGSTPHRGAIWDISRAADYSTRHWVITWPP
jgi:hypothetical protein